MPDKTMVRASMVQPEDLEDRLYKAYISNKLDTLPDVERKVLERMEYADDLIRSGGKYMVYKNVVNEMISHFLDHEIVKRTIENDIARAKRFFLSNYKKEDKEYARGVRIEWLNKIAEEAREDGDFRSAVAAIKEGNDCLGLKKEDIDLPDYTKIERQPILIISDPALIKLPMIENLEEELRKLRSAKSSFMKDAVEDVEFTEEGLDDD